MAKKKTQEDKDYIETLKERDKPMPMGKYIWKSEICKDMPPTDTCGKCGRHINGNDYVFCPVCGQRIDHENYVI